MAVLSESLAFEIYFIELWHIFSVIFVVIVNYYIYLNARKNPLLYSFLAVESLLFIWLVSKIFKTVSPNVDIRWFFIVTQYFGNCFLGSTFFAFACTYAKGRLPATKILILTALPSLFFFLSMATNPLHMQFYSYYDFYRDSFGPLFYFNQAYSYGMIFIGIYLCGKQFFLEFSQKRMQAILLSVAVLIPVIVNILYIAKLFKPLFGFRPLFDITPITCNLSLVLFAFATFKYRFFDIAPIAWRKVFNRIPESILLLNKKQIPTDMNRTASVTPETNEIIQATLEKISNNSPLEFLYTASTGKQFRVLWASPSGSHKNKGNIIRFIDDTMYQEALTTVSDKNQALVHVHQLLRQKADAKQALATYKTRNYMGREVHDILGHSIVLALSVLEVAKICCKNDFAVAKEKFAQAVSIIKNAKEKMDNGLLVYAEDSALQNDNLVAALNKLVYETNLTGQNINLTVQGDNTELDQNVCEAVLRLCQEAVTNAIRHGKADEINIIIRFLSGSLKIFVIDDGKGCLEIKKGFGLLGMEERIVRDLKGTLHFASLDHGFTINAVVPVKSN